MRDILRRVHADRGASGAFGPASGSDPAAGAADRVHRDHARPLEGGIAFHLDSGLPGDRTAVELLYVTGLIVEPLTLPGVLGDEEALVSAPTNRAATIAAR